MSMSMYTCAEVRDLAAELALGIVGGAERAEAIMHVNGCARCQALVLELTEAADALPLLAPEREPSVGFEQRVLARMHTRRTLGRRRVLAAVAAVAAAAAIVSITVVRVVESDQSSPAAATHPGVTSKPVAVAMRDTAAGLAAGWAYVTAGHSVAVTVDYAVGPGRYSVVARAATGVSRTLGAMTVDGGRGSWTGGSALPIGAGDSVGLVDASGHWVCHGTLGTAE